MIHLLDHPILCILLAPFAMTALIAPFYFAAQCRRMSLRSKNIQAHGWPPPYLDADGDIDSALAEKIYGTSTTGVPRAPGTFTITMDHEANDPDRIFRSTVERLKPGPG